MKKGGMSYKLLLSAIFSILLLGVVYAITITTDHTSISTTDGYLISEPSIINITVANGEIGTGNNITNLTIDIPSDLVFNELTNATNTTSSFSNLSTSLIWILENSSDWQVGHDYWFAFNVTPNASIEEANISIFVTAFNNTGGNDQVTIINFSIDTLSPRVGLQTTNATNTTNVSSFTFDLEIEEFTPQACSLYTRNITATSNGIEDGWGVKTNATLTSANTSGLNHNFSVTGDGIYEWNVYCNDTAANSAFNESNFTITVDNAAPDAISFLTHTAGDNVTETIEVNVSITDATSGVDTVTIQNGTGGSLVSMNRYEGTANDGNWTVMLNTTSLSAGPNTFTINATDFLGLSNDSESIVLNVDNENPNVTLSTPIDGFNTSATSLDLNWTVLDNIDTVPSCDVYVDDVLNATIATQNNTLTNFTVQGLNDGTHTWNVTCFDDVGRSNASTQRSFVVDSTNPDGASFITHSSQDNVTGTIEVNVTVTDATSGVETVSIQNGTSGSWIYLTRYEGDANDGNWTVSLDTTSLSLGANTFTLNITDFAENENSSESIVLNVDNSNPIVTLNAPADGLNQTSPTVSFNFTATDDTTPILFCNITVNGEVNVSNIRVVNNTEQINSSLLGEGSHEWNVTCLDSLGNSNTSLTRIVTVDTQIPLGITFLTHSNNDNISGSSVEINVSVTDSGSGVEFVSISNGTSGNYLAMSRYEGDASDGNWTITIDSTELTNVAHTFTINATDFVGNENSSEFVSLNVDNNLPTITLHYPTNDLNLSSTTADFNFTVEDNADATLQCNISVNGLVNVSDITATNGTAQVNSSLLGEGDYNWSVSCIDSLENVGTSSVLDFTIDATNPAGITFLTHNPADNISSIVVVNVSVVDSSTGVATVTIQNGTGGSIVDMVLYQGTSTDGNWTATLNSENLNLGANTFTINATDHTSNSNSSEAISLNVDNIDPVVTLDSPVDGFNTSTTSIEFNFTVTDDIDTVLSCDLNINGVANVSSIVSLNNTETNQSVAGFTDGSYMWNVTCRDDGLNENTSLTRSFTVDTTPPAGITFITPTNGASVSGAIEVNVSITDSLTGVASVFVQNGSSGSFVPMTLYEGTATDGNWSATIDVTSLADGEQNLTINATDFVGNLNSSAYITINVDTTAPSISLDAPVEGANTTSSVTFNWTATDTIDTELVCNLTIDGTVNATANSPSGISTNRTITDLTDGAHTWNVTCIDDQENVNTSITQNFTVDGVAPQLNANASNATSARVGDVVVITANFSDTATAVNTMQLLVNGTAVATNTTMLDNHSVRFNFTTTSAYEGGHINFTVRATDYAGNSHESDNFLVTIVDSTAPNMVANSPLTHVNLSSATVSFNFTATDETDTILDCNISVDDNVNISDILATSGTAQINTSTLADGTYNWTATCLDDQANSNSTTTQSFSVDTTAPTLNANATSISAGNPGQVVHITANFTDATTSVNNLTLYVNGSLHETNGSSSYNNQLINYTFTLNTTFELGQVNFTIVALDSAANSQSTDSLLVTVNDATAPTITLNAPANLSNLSSQSVSFNFTATDADPSLTCNITVDGSVAVSNISVVAGTAQVNSSTVTDGLHTWNVTCEDTQLNTATSDTYTFTVDSTAPAYDTEHFGDVNISATSFSGGDLLWMVSNWTDVTFDVEAVVLYFDGSIVSTNDTVTEGTPVNLSYTIPVATNGTIEVYMWANDTLANNNETVRFNVTVMEALAPNITLSYPADYANLSSNSVTFNFTAQDNLDSVLSCNITVDNYVNVSGINATNASVTSAASTLADGTYLWNVTCTDDYGNVNTSDTRTVNVDTVAPVLNANSSNVTTAMVNYDVLVSANFTDAFSNVDSVILLVNGTVNQTNASYNLNDLLVSFVYQVSSAYENGVVNLTLRANDSAGNTRDSDSFLITVEDSTAPSITVNGPEDNFNTTSATVSFNFTTDDASALVCNVSVDGVVNISGIIPTNGTAQVNSSVQQEGAHNWSVLCEDPQNSSTSSTVRNFAVDTIAPTIVSVSPANNTNMTSNTSLFTIVTSDATSNVREIHYNITGTACNVSTTNATNNTQFNPYNQSVGCLSAAESSSFVITVYDHAGNSIIIDRSYILDNVPPAFSTISVPQAGTDYTSPVNLNFTVSDGFEVSEVGYYLNTDELLVIAAEKTGNTYNFTQAFSAGTHTITFWANDTAGNQENASSVTFRVVAPVNLTEVLDDLIEHNGGNDVSTITIKNSSDSAVNDTVDINQSLEIVITTNSSGTDVNVSLDIADGLAVTWDSNFSVNSDNDSSSAVAINQNWSTTTLVLVEFDSGINDFLTNQSEYFGAVTLPFDANLNLTAVWWFEDETDYTNRTEVSECTTVGNTTAYTATQESPCYNVTIVGQETVVYVPHFSTVVGTSDTDAPSVTLVAPGAQESTSTFTINVSTSLDADTCYFNVLYNDTESISSLDNVTNTSAIAVESFTTFSACSIEASFDNANYTLVVWINDTAGNINESFLGFEMLDSATPELLFSSSDNVTVSTTSATLSWSATEKVNASISYGTNETDLGTNDTNSSFNSTDHTFTLSSLSAGSVYYYNITTCDYANNCLVNGTFSFNTSSASSSSSSSSSSSGGSSGGQDSGAVSTPADTTVIAQKTKQWAVVSPTEPAMITISSEEIALETITLKTDDTYYNAEISVARIEKPSELTKPTGEVYQYFDIDVKRIPSRGFGEAEITFKIPLSWFEGNAYKRATVRLMHFDERWKFLATEETSADSEYVYFKSPTRSFSYFAIVADTTEEETAPVEQDPSEAPPQLPETEEQVPPPVEEEETTQTSNHPLLIIGILVVLIAFFFYLYSKKQ